MADQVIYVDGLGFIPIASGQTPQDAIAAAQGKRGPGDQGGSLGVGAGGNFAGLQMPQSMEQGVPGSGGPEDILRAFPQLAGIIAQFTPVGKAGYAANAAVPAVADIVMRAIRGEPFDVESAVTNGAMGMAGKATGNLIGGAGRGGEGIVRRSLNLKSGPFAYNEVAEDMIPKRLITEKAKMTKPGVAAMEAKAQATGSGGMADAAEALKKARYDADNAPNMGGGGIMAMISDLIGPPRQMEIGSAINKPFGISTEKAIAPAAETGLRALMALIASQMSGMRDDVPEQANGPRRRSQR